MPSRDINIQDVENSPIAIANVGGNVTGDIIAGNKTIINNIIQQAAKQIVTAPYKFLHSYDICDRDIFFGRDAVIEDVLGKLPRSKALVINGRSGAGKTSLINAGLIPRLAENGYHFISFREYRDPLAQLREYTAQNDPFRPFADAAGSLAHFLKTATRQHKMRLALIFDQFERFFAHVPAALQTQFIQEIKTCLDSDLTGAELDLIFALREDFLGAFMLEFESAIPAFFQDAERFNLYPLLPENAREAIIKPLKNLPVHLGYDPRFVDDVLLPGLIGESVEDARIDPPNLQIVCNQLYEKAIERHAADLDMGSVVQISRQLYEELGETRGILRGYLDDFIDHAAYRDSGGRDALRSMLKLMTETTGTRKFVSFTDLTRGLPDVPPADIERHLRACQDGRIIETRGKEDDIRYSLSHDVMVAKVAEWFDERELQRKKAQETLERGLAEWKSSQTILTKKQIKRVRTWLKGSLDEQAKQFLKQSERRLRLKAALSLISGLLLVGLLFTAIFRLVPTLFYQFDQEEGSTFIVMKQGKPSLNLPLFGFPKSLDPTMAYTGYAVNDITDMRRLLRISFSTQEEKFPALIPLLHVALRGAAYEKLGLSDEAIRASVQAIRELSGAKHEHDRENAALLLIRQSEKADAAARQLALDTLAEVGRGYALRELETLEKTAAPAVAETANAARQRIEMRITQTMVRIPAGEFVMGIVPQDVRKLSLQYDVARDYFMAEVHEGMARIANEFLIDRDEVTNKEYVDYLNQLGTHQHNGISLITLNSESSMSRILRDGETYRLIDNEYQRHPVVMVNWAAARAYCEWQGKRLPSEAEWERAARGVQGNTFPWGDDFAPDKANLFQYWPTYWYEHSVPENQQQEMTLAVGSFPDGRSPEGVEDMTGNVWEWTNDLYTVYPGNTNAEGMYNVWHDDKNYRVVRGGAFDEYHFAGRASMRFPRQRDVAYDNVGFRCVFDPEHDTTK